MKNGVFFSEFWSCTHFWRSFAIIHHWSYMISWCWRCQNFRTLWITLCTFSPAPPGSNPSILVFIIQNCRLLAFCWGIVQILVCSTSVATTWPITTNIRIGILANKRNNELTNDTSRRTTRTAAIPSKPPEIKSTAHLPILNMIAVIWRCILLWWYPNAGMDYNLPDTRLSYRILLLFRSVLYHFCDEYRKAKIFAISGSRTRDARYATARVTIALWRTTVEGQNLQISVDLRAKKENSLFLKLKYPPQLWEATPKFQNDKRFMNLENTREWVRVLQFAGEGTRFMGCSKEALADCQWLQFQIPSTNEQRYGVSFYFIP